MTAWWTRSVGYQVYVRSFADTDADGTGDLLGVTARLGHLADLGIGLLWLTPCYPSPGADHGYDVADYRDVAAVFGGMPALDALVDRAHALGMHVLMDLVPNHTSDQHAWFQRALADPDGPERDFYVFRDPAPDGGPPNNWVSHFGGRAWTLDPASGQYYLHLFLPQQPDLNWDNPAVRREFEDILRFWFARGIDGFRIDVAHALVKDPSLRDNPIRDATVLDSPQARLSFDGMEHLHDLDQTAVVDIFRDWRRIADEHDALLVGEVYLLDPRRVARYVAPDALHAAFCFPALRTDWDAQDIRSTLEGATDASLGRFAWPMSSHDDPRAAERFGGGALGAERALAYFTLLSVLPGLPFLYQGDELGLDNGDLDPAVFEDPASRGRDVDWSRDAVRTPMPWDDGPGRGFSAGTPWLPIPANHGPGRSVASQVADEQSILQRYRRLLHSRRDWLPATDDVRWLRTDPDVVAVRRGDVTVVLNTGIGAVELDIGPRARLHFATQDDVSVDDGVLRLPPDCAAVVGDAADLVAV
jgi:alpha-glucosidase